ncbi:unnamed protein product, partial [Larinioides sclopetarius]
ERPSSVNKGNLSTVLQPQQVMCLEGRVLTISGPNWVKMVIEEETGQEEAGVIDWKFSFPVPVYKAKNYSIGLITGIKGRYSAELAVNKRKNCI